MGSFTRILWATTFALFCIFFSAKANAQCVAPDAYKHTVKRWNDAMQHVGTTGTCWIGTLSGGGQVDRLHKNGRRDTIIFAPSNANFMKPMTIIFWWHGLGGFSKREFIKRILPNVASLSLQGQNFVLVISELPWSTNTRTPRGRQGRAWTGKTSENFVTYYYASVSAITQHIIPDDVQRALCAQDGYCGFSPANVVIIGHSAGGSALKSAAKSGALDLIQPNRIIFSDAGYGRWTDTTWNHHVHDHPGCEFVLLVRKWDRPHKHTMRFLRRFRGRVAKHIHLTIFPRRQYTHTAIGDQALMWTFKKL